MHLDPQGNVDLLDGAYVPTPGEVDPQPKLTATEAAQRAEAGVAGAKAGSANAPELIIYGRLQQKPRLAWRTTVVASVLNEWIVIVDAQDGQVLDQITQCLDANVPTSGADALGATRSINVWGANNKYYMADTTKPSFDPAFDPVSNPHGVISIFDAHGIPLEEIDAAIQAGQVGLTESSSATSWVPEAVGAMYSFERTYDYYQARHNRNSVDGQGENLQALVRVGVAGRTLSGRRPTRQCSSVMPRLSPLPLMLWPTN